MGREIKTFTGDELGDEICCVVGTRPGIVMFAPIIHELKERGANFFVIHTGQHYSPNMDLQFFDDLELPKPDYRIDGVAENKTHGTQTAAMLSGIEEILMDRRPRLVLVGGDANTNLAGALAARKLNIMVGHVESGNRSYDWRMPEEHNRVIIDHMSDLLFASDDDAMKVLNEEAIHGRILKTGNTIVDASMQNLEIARKKSSILKDFDVKPGKYGLMTAHREEYVDVKEQLESLLQGVSDAGGALDIEVIFLMHPRTEKRLNEFSLMEWAKGLPYLRLEPAIGYLDFIRLLSDAHIFFTDSGGGQQEACIHHIPCVTTRDTTEWPDTLRNGANRLAGSDPERIVAQARAALEAPRDWDIPFGDGTAAKQIVDASIDALEAPPKIGLQPGEVRQVA